jgi:MFS family permease
MFVSGMGFFTDAYDLFVIGIVVALLKTEWGLSTTQISLLNSATLAASAVGAIVFGPLLASGLLASGLSNDTTWRVLLAFGALPGLAVFYLRRQIHETPRFAMAGGAADEAEAAIKAATADSGGGRAAARVGQPGLRGQRILPGGPGQAARG